MFAAQLGAAEHNSVDASETASSTNSVSGNSPVMGQTANHNHSRSAKAYADKALLISVR